MNKVNTPLIPLVLLILFISSCSTTEEVPKGKFATGIIIVNEGNFSEANGSVGFFNEVNWWS
jgi:hypothetical protein